MVLRGFYVFLGLFLIFHTAFAHPLLTVNGFKESAIRDYVSNTLVPLIAVQQKIPFSEDNPDYGLKEFKFNVDIHSAFSSMWTSLSMKRILRIEPSDEQHAKIQAFLNLINKDFEEKIQSRFNYSQSKESLITMYDIGWLALFMVELSRHYDLIKDHDQALQKAMLATAKHIQSTLFTIKGLPFFDKPCGVSHVNLADESLVLSHAKDAIVKLHKSFVMQSSLLSESDTANETQRVFQLATARGSHTDLFFLGYAFTKLVTMLPSDNISREKMLMISRNVKQCNQWVSKIHVENHAEIISPATMLALIQKRKLETTTYLLLKVQERANVSPEKVDVLFTDQRIENRLGYYASLIWPLANILEAIDPSIVTFVNLFFELTAKHFSNQAFSPKNLSDYKTKEALHQPLRLKLDQTELSAQEKKYKNVIDQSTYHRLMTDAKKAYDLEVQKLYPKNSSMAAFDFQVRQVHWLPQFLWMTFYLHLDES